ncbi:MAG TPA: lipopolysaccharide biosynthesis protein [Candidatus Brocadiia bacterium]|nr:lipopolysaccharide biosynthesis protein [Candidatus Brocadiia bacterium]
MTEDHKKPDSKLALMSALTLAGVQVMTVLTSVIVARVLGPVGKGQFGAAQPWPMFFATFGLLGIRWSIAHKLGTQKERVAVLARIAFRLAIVFSIIWVVIGWFGLPYLLGEERRHIWAASRLMLTVLPLTIMANCMIGLDYGLGRLDRQNLAAIVLQPMFLVALMVFWLTGRLSVITAVLSFMIANALVVTVRMAQYGKYLSGPVTIRTSEYIEVIRGGLWYLIPEIARSLLEHWDKFLVIYILGDADRGIYETALGAAFIASFVGGAANNVTFSRAVVDQNPEAQKDFLRRMFKLSGPVYMGTALAATLGSPILLRIFYGSAYAPGMIPCAVMCWGVMFQNIADMTEYGLWGRKIVLPGVISRAIYGLALSLVAIYLVKSLGMGIMGVAVAKVVGAAAFAVAMTLFCSRHYSLKWLDLWRWEFFESFRRVTGACVQMADRFRLPVPGFVRAIGASKGGGGVRFLF